MRIFVAGASGAVGKRLIPALVKGGHHVIGMTHSLQKRNLVHSLGADHVAADGLDRDAVVREVTRTQPDVIVQEMTAIPTDFNPRKFEQIFALTDRLRMEGTDNLFEAAHAAGVRRVVAQSYCGWPYAYEGAPIKTEDDPLEADPAPVFRRSLSAIRQLESTVTQTAGIDGLVLRYGPFYGPGTNSDWMLDQIRNRRMPIVGDGAAVWSFIHIDDVAAATRAAIENGRPGIYNIVDDEPAAVAEWLPELARMLGARPPKRLPVWVARLVMGEAGVVLMTRTRGASNLKAKRNLGWEPYWKTWRDGFRNELAQSQGGRAA